MRINVMCVAEFNAGRGTRYYSCNNTERERERERMRIGETRAVEKEVRSSLRSVQVSDLCLVAVRSSAAR